MTRFAENYDPSLIPDPPSPVDPIWQSVRAGERVDFVSPGLTDSTGLRDWTSDGPAITITQERAMAPLPRVVPMAMAPSDDGAWWKLGLLAAGVLFLALRRR
jgi:hypothetical protein